MNLLYMLIAIVFGIGTAIGIFFLAFLLNNFVAFVILSFIGVVLIKSFIEEAFDTIEKDK